MTFPLSIKHRGSNNKYSQYYSCISEPTNTSPVKLNGVLSGFKVRKPTNGEINNLYSDSVTMTADSPEWYPMDSRCQVEEKEMHKDLNEDLNHNPRDRRIQLIYSHINQNKRIIPQVHFNADLQYCSISHK